MRRLVIALLTTAAVWQVCACGDNVTTLTGGVESVASAATIRCAIGYTRRGNRCVKNPTPTPTPSPTPSPAPIPTPTPVPIPPTPLPPVTWTTCGYEGGVCYVAAPANVRYGEGDLWTSQRAVTSSIGCDNATWGDPAVGFGKMCQTDGQPGSAPAPVPTPAPSPPPPPPTPAPAPSPTPPALTLNHECWNGVGDFFVAYDCAPPAPPSSWTAAPLVIGGYARASSPEQSVPKIAAALGYTYGEPIYRTLAAGEVVRLYQRYPDIACQCAGEPRQWTVFGLDGRFIGYLWETNLSGVAPAP